MKISKILSRFSLKVSFTPVKEINFSSPKDFSPIENQSGINFVPCSSCNLIYIDQTRRRLKARYEKHRRKIKNKEINTSSISSH